MELKEIKGIGPKSLELLNSLNIYNVNDLLEFYPFRYNIYKPTNLENTLEDEIVTINATIETTPRIFYIKKNLNRLTFKVLTNNLLIQVTIFNRAFLYKNLDVGKNIILVGKYSKQKNTFVANDIRIGFLNETQIEPIYHTVKGLKMKQISNYIKDALSKENEYTNYIPKYFINLYKFISKEEAIKIIHNPSNSQELKNARLCLIYEEFFVFMLKIAYLKKRNEKIIGIAKNFSSELIKDFIKKLPFALTTDQLKAISECLNDLKSNKKMNRLIEGDVGSGKTIVSVITMYANYLSGYQSALMAPTEILAKQHYETVKNLLKKENIKVGLLIGSQKKSEQTKILEQLKAGEINIVIGTHALISKNVIFKNLGLVITDEQHRFGVNQRSSLHNKGIEPDIIYMSATPIPRTYALTIYQDMDTSIIKTKPSGRKEIKTFLKKESELKSVLTNILEEIKKGHQIYVVAPSIIESEEKNIHDVFELKDSFDKAFNNKVKTAVLHGKIKLTEKEKIMQEFKEGEIKILIATTVIEVGIDVENATTIVIFNAEMFGLATLHQLRGRVGRNEIDSYCYLISDYDKDRLKVLVDSNDGFYISEQDFLMRHGGDIFGTRQSGDMIFKIADLKRDFKILLQAKKDANFYLEQDKISDKYKKILNCITNID